MDRRLVARLPCNRCYHVSYGHFASRFPAGIARVSKDARASHRRGSFAKKGQQAEREMEGYRPGHLSALEEYNLLVQFACARGFFSVWWCCERVYR